MLEQSIRQARAKKDILLMTHIVLGYPSFDDSLRMVEDMVKAGVDLMELQIPFSEPMADGPVILKANAEALKNGATVEQSFRIAERITKEFDIPFLFMAYYNILYCQGVASFVDQCRQAGIQGCIIPDLPPAEGQEYLDAMHAARLSPIHIFTPNTPVDRMRHLSDNSAGFIYTVARKGVTGKDTAFSDELTDYLALCNSNTDLPLAVGFGVKTREDVNFLRGKVDIAVVGSETIRVMERDGVGAVKGFIETLID
ncbi:tryptophan synthase subunit alpha [Chromatiales bacterium (ex Bugula neritina AB1)]|nr:tryptophan synthase subunit alpha [Chromatiales bacterium (ex Bugula neritina AB1)]